MGASADAHVVVVNGGGGELVVVNGLGHRNWIDISYLVYILFLICG